MATTTFEAVDIVDDPGPLVRRAAQGRGVAEPGCGPKTGAQVCGSCQWRLAWRPAGHR